MGDRLDHIADAIKTLRKELDAYQGLVYHSPNVINGSAGDNDGYVVIGAGGKDGLPLGLSADRSDLPEVSLILLNDDNAGIAFNVREPEEISGTPSANMPWMGVMWVEGEEGRLKYYHSNQGKIDLLANNYVNNEVLVATEAILEACDGYTAQTKTKVSNSDATPEFLEDKILAGDNILITKSVDGGTESLTISSIDQVSSSTELQEKVKVDSSDTSEYLEEKVIAGDNIVITKVSDGGVKYLKIEAIDQTTGVEFSVDGYEVVKTSADDQTPDYLDQKVVAGDNIIITKVSDGGTEHLVIEAVDQVTGVEFNADGYEVVKVDSEDQTAGYLNGKLAPGSNVTFDIVDNGGTKTLYINSLDQEIAALVTSHGQFSEILQSIRKDMDGYDSNYHDLKGWLETVTTQIIKDLDGYETEESADQKKQFINDTFDTILKDLDGYEPELSAQQFKDFVYDALTTIRKDLDGYNTTITEHYDQHSDVFNTIRKDLDGYNTTITEHYDQHSEAIQTLRKDLDGYNTTLTEHFDQHSDAIDTIRKDLDGYNTTITEHYDQHSATIQTIRKDLDGYNTTLTEHYDQHSDAIDTIRKDLDGYNTTITEHYDQHSEAFQTIRKGLDGYQSNLTEHEGALQSILKDLDGYVDYNVTGYPYPNNQVAFWYELGGNDGNTLYGHNDFLYNVVSNKLQVGYSSSNAGKLQFHSDAGVDGNANLSVIWDDDSTSGEAVLRLLSDNSDRYAFVGYNIDSGNPDLYNNFMIGIATDVATERELSGHTSYITLSPDGNMLLGPNVSGTTFTAEHEVDINGVLNLYAKDPPTQPSGTDTNGLLYVNDYKLYFSSLAHGDIDLISPISFAVSKFVDMGDAIKHIVDAIDGYTQSAGQFPTMDIQLYPSSGFSAVPSSGGMLYADNPHLFFKNASGRVFSITGMLDTSDEHDYQHDVAIKHIIDTIDGYTENTGRFPTRDLVLYPSSGAVDIPSSGGLLYADSPHLFFKNFGGTTVNITATLTGLGDTVNQHAVQTGLAFESIRKEADGYGTAIQTIRKELDGYNQTITEHYDQHSEAITTLRKALDDGYADIQQASDGYIAFFAGDTSIAGDNDLFWDRENNNLHLGKDVIVGGKVNTTGIKMSTGANLGYFLTTDNDGNASWAEATASLDWNKALSFPDGSDDFQLCWDDDGNIMALE